MIRTRVELQSALQSIIGTRSDGRPNVHYQTPKNIQLVYPCIMYEKTNMTADNADNTKFYKHETYKITYISTDILDPNVDTIWDLPFCRFDRQYPSDGLYHTIFILTT